MELSVNENLIHDNESSSNQWGKSIKNINKLGLSVK